MKADWINTIANGEAVGICTHTETLARVNFTLLKTLLNGENQVLFLALEKPHHYMSHLLGINGISQRNLTYLDIKSPDTVRITFPLTIGTNRGVQVAGFIPRDMIILEDYDYVILDNVEFLNHMWSRESVTEFLKRIINECKTRDIPVFIPLKKSEKTKKILEEVVDRIINIDEVSK